MTSMDEEQAADTYCRYLATHHYENFAVASWFLPGEIRLHLARLYAYCRTTDDIGDESGPDAIPRLAAWQQQVEECFKSGVAPIHPVLIALRQTIRDRHLPSQPFLDLIAANMQDQIVSSYESWDNLREYCLLSAAPVGRLVLRIWGVQGPTAERLSDDVCIGLQLANFAQDVAIDRAKQRTYLIQADIRERGVEGAVQALCDRAAHLLASGRDLETLVPGLLRIQLRLYRLGGAAIISAIAGMDYHTDLSRPHVSRVTKLGLVPRAALPSRPCGPRVMRHTPG